MTMSAVDPHTEHLRPVPAYEEYAAPVVEAAPPPPPGVPGLTPPLQRGHSRGAVVDVLVELGYVTREAVEVASEQARLAGRTPETLLLDQGQISADQLTRATAERYGP